jgi:transcriptional regulator with XRE-family HTH domain
MIDEDLRQIRQVLARAVQASGILRRDLERALRLRNGSLAQLLDGRLDLRVEHLTALARLLRIPPGDLLAAGAPAANAAAEHRLADWLGLAAPATSAISAAIAPAAPSPDELAAMVRSAVQQALAERKAS